MGLSNRLGLSIRRLGLELAEKRLDLGLSVARLGLNAPQRLRLLVARLGLSVPQGLRLLVARIGLSTPHRLRLGLTVARLRLSIGGLGLTVKTRLGLSNSPGLGHMDLHLLLIRMYLVILLLRAFVEKEDAAAKSADSHDDADDKGR